MSTFRERNMAPVPPLRNSSLRANMEIDHIQDARRPYSYAENCLRLVSAGSVRSNRSLRLPTMSAISRDMNVRRWDGAGRESTQWDGLRRDPELWFPDGNCYVHLYGRGQSQRGPAFRLPYHALLATNCRPLLDRFMTDNFAESPISDTSSNEDGGFFGHPAATKHFDLYIPAPPTAEREQAFLYHMATRNFFAWIFGKSLVGTHLGGALVGLLNSMNEFRSQGEDNVQAILDYMDDEGYADMRNSPDHALAILFFAEHFEFRDMWIDAFAHCCGMNDILITSGGFEHMTRKTRAFVTRSRMEMDMRLEHCGFKLSTFLSDELSEANLNLSSAARAHLDKFRTWLHSYYVAKLGYYPPKPLFAGSTAFPSCIYRQMRTEFQKLYNALVDTSLAAADSFPLSRQGGICILQNTQAFDARCKHKSQSHPYPLLPEGDSTSTRSGRRLSWFPKKTDKLKPDERLVSFASLTKAMNRAEEKSYDCSLVRAYRGFEKECVFSSSKEDKDIHLSLTEARKVRWLLIYAILQTLNSVTQVPVEVRDVQNVPYNLCVLTAGCPPWSGKRPIETLLRTQSDQSKEDYLKSLAVTEKEPELYDNFEIKPDIDYSSRLHHSAPARRKSESASSILASRRGSIRRALSTMGTVPELHHPSPRRASFHEILVHGYGNGTNKVTEKGSKQSGEAVTKRKLSAQSTASSEGPSSRWSLSSYDTIDEENGDASEQSDSRRPSDASNYSVSRSSISSLLDQPLGDFSLRRMSVASSCYSDNVFEPEPLSIGKHKPKDHDYYMTITTDIQVDYDDASPVNAEEVDALEALTSQIAAAF